MIQIHTEIVTPFQQNARLVVCERTKRSVLIDPGGEADRLLRLIDSSGSQLEAVWLTHSHIDHCGGVAPILRARQVPLLAHPGERFFRERVEQIAVMYGIADAGCENCPEPDTPISGGETLRVGELEFTVLFTPGHSPGHLCFFHKDSGSLLAGDTLFAGSIGRTDLPGADHATLLQSISREILSLPDQTKVLSGHGPDTTVGEERRSNPFLRG